MENGRKERQEGKGPVGMEREREFSSTYPFVILKSDSSHQSNKEKKWRKCVIETICAKSSRTLTIS